MDSKEQEQTNATKSNIMEDWVPPQVHYEDIDLSDGTDDTVSDTEGEERLITQQEKTLGWMPFMDNERIRQIILQNKKLYNEYYKDNKYRMVNQLEHALAAQMGDYIKSPYNEEKHDDYQTPIKILIEKLKTQDLPMSKEAEDNQKIIEFLELQLEHVNSMITKEYEQSPYLQNKMDTVEQIVEIHKHISSKLIDEIIEELDKIAKENTKIYNMSEDTSLGEHLYMLRDIHDSFEKGDEELIMDMTISDEDEEDTDSDDWNDSTASETEITENVSLEMRNEKELRDNVNGKEETDKNKTEIETTKDREIEEQKREIQEYKKKLKTQQETIETQEIYIQKLENDTNLLNQQITILKKQLTESDEEERRARIELKEKLITLRQEYNKLETTNKQLLQKLRKIQLTIEAKQHEIENKTEKIENLRKELSTIKGKTTKRNKPQVKEKAVGTQKQTENSNIDLTIIQNQKEDGKSDTTITKENNALELKDPAILIKCMDDAQISSIQEILNETILNQNMMQTIHTRLARDKRTIIVKAQEEEALKQLHHNLNNNDKVIKQVEINYKKNRTKRIIITGIPTTYSAQQILQHIKNYYGNETIDENNIIKTKNSKITKYYQMVIQTDLQLAAALLKDGYMKMGSRRCIISVYKPIIRCSNCQLYGHGAHTCVRISICAYCAQGHHSSVCPNGSLPELINCTNCLDTAGYVPHSADSSRCPVYVGQLVNRNNITKSMNNTYMNSYIDYYINSNTNSYMNSILNTTAMGFGPHNGNSVNYTGSVFGT